MSSQDDLFMLGSIVLSERGDAAVGWVGMAACFLWLLADAQAIVATTRFSYWMAVMGGFDCCASVAAFRRWNYVPVRARGNALMAVTLLVLGTGASLFNLLQR